MKFYDVSFFEISIFHDIIFYKFYYSLSLKKKNTILKKNFIQSIKQDLFILSLSNFVKILYLLNNFYMNV